MSNLIGYIVSFNNSDEYAMFYKPDEQGYTNDINKAGLYSLKKGLEIQKSTHNENVWVSIFDVLPKIKKMLMTNDIKKINEEEQFAAKLYDFLLKTELEDYFRSWLMDDYEYFGYEIVDKPLGEKQNFNHEPLDSKEEIIEMPEEFKYIDHEYCDQQVDGGMRGDEYSGDLYFPLPNGKYLKCHYDC